MPTLPAQSLQQLTQAVIEKAGTPPDTAHLVSTLLVDANLAGHDSHGVLRLPWYINIVREGKLLPTAQPSIAAEHGAVARIDGALGWGQLAAQLATQTAIRIANDQGIGAAVIFDSNHIGRLGSYVEQIAQANMVGMMWCNAGPAVAPYGGYQRVMGTNPLAWAAPGGPGEPPLVLDFATSAVAEGKLRVARARGEQVASNIIVDATGAATQNPHDFYNGGSLLTFGLHKGSGLSIMIELLGRGLAGVDPNVPGNHGHNGVTVIALNIPAVTAPEQFATSADQLLAQVSASPPATGFSEVLLPGEPERRMRQIRLAEGIPLADSTWDEIKQVADELGVPVE